MSTTKDRGDPDGQASYRVRSAGVHRAWRSKALVVQAAKVSNLPVVVQSARNVALQSLYSCVVMVTLTRTVSPTRLPLAVQATWMVAAADLAWRQRCLHHLRLLVR